MAEHTWLLFTPQRPTAPSSLRVTVWRRLQQAGEVSAGQGMWMLPQTPEHACFFADLLRDIQAQGGSGLLLVASALNATLERNTDHHPVSGRTSQGLH